MHFESDSLDVFERVPSGKSWGDVPITDQDAFKDLRSRLKNLIEAANVKTGLQTATRTYVSHPTPNGRSPRELWCCLFPESSQNKSFAFQIALILSIRGAEICFCLGSGTHQSGNTEKILNSKYQFERAKAKLATAKGKFEVPAGWKLKTKWLDDNFASDVSTFEDWIDFAIGNSGNSASISKFIRRSDAAFDSTDFLTEFQNAVHDFGSLFDYIYQSTPTPADATPSKTSAFFNSENEIFNLGKALLAKPFTILTGASGTGKTKLAESLATYLSNSSKNNSAVIAVGADWTDNRNVLGFVNHLRTDEDSGHPT